MSPSEARYGLLVRLAWELRSVPLDCRILLPRDGEPVLYVVGPDGQCDAVLAGQREGSWRVFWRGRELGTAQLDLTAGFIAREMAA